jgi:hypothetical protein
VATPEPSSAPADLTATRRGAAVVPAVIFGSGILFTVVGMGLMFAVDLVVGAVFVAIGLSDLMLAPFLRRRLSAGVREAELKEVESGSTDAAVADADPSYNPYARED